MEIFTFLRMGGAMERIELRLIANPGQNQAAAKKELAAQLARGHISKQHTSAPSARKPWVQP